VTDEVARLEGEIEVLRAENSRLRARLEIVDEVPAPELDLADAAGDPTLFAADEAAARPRVTARSAPAAKVALFRSLFGGRTDVYATRWTNRQGRSGWSPAVVGGPANARKPDRQYRPLTDDVVAAHLTGGLHIGLYPLLPDDTCRLLACDFDGPSWRLDAGAFIDAAQAAQLPVALERSQSGNGAHVWMFFAGPVPAQAARRVAAHLLREAMTIRAELDLASYDRFFPSQDFMPAGSFGNLIGLPLQGLARRRGATVFLDATTFEPHADQWAHLSSIAMSAPAAIVSMAATIREVAAGPLEPAYRPPLGRATPPPMPPAIKATSVSMLSIDRIGIPPALISALKHVASLRNPAFYEKERLRLSTWKTPRFVRCYRETVDELLLPRGLRELAASLVAEAGSRLEVREVPRDLRPIDVTFEAELTSDQIAALEAVSRHDLGVLVAPPGAGKTVVACAVIARRATPTLILVDRQPLLDQWRDRLMTHLGLKRNEIGLIGGGRNRARGVVDVAMVQSLARREDVAGLTAPYGLVVVDECHHVPAVTFERVVREIGAPGWLGLTATPYRRDGLEGLITMYCGPVRHRIEKHGTTQPEFARRILVHRTSHAPPATASTDGRMYDATPIQDVFRALVEDTTRTDQIARDIAAATRSGRNCLVLSQWTQHLRQLERALVALEVRADVLQGGVGRKARREISGRLSASRVGDGIVLLATGSFLGEGFDCPPLDTLFLTFPIAFKGRLVQYVGRLLRPVAGKSLVEVHDYVDVRIPVLARMHRKRLASYASLGFASEDPGGEFVWPPGQQGLSATS
jgi:hypothetical protein